MSHERWTCADLEPRLFVHLRDGLPVHDAVRAQAHLADCEACTAMTRRWSQWTDAIDEGTDAPLTREHATRLTDAIMSADVDVVATAPRKRSSLRWIGAAVAVAAASVLVVIAPREQTDAPVLGGLSHGAVIAVSTEPLRFGRVVMRGAARVHVEGRSRIVVDEGNASFDVDPLLHGQELEACTARTCARVIGTSFQVVRGADGGRDRIVVAHGVVAVSAIDGGGEVFLHAGESYEAPWSGVPVPPSPRAGEGSVKRSATQGEGARVDGPPPAAFVCPRSDEAIARLAGRAALHCLEDASVDSLLAVAERMLSRNAPRDAELVFAELIERFPRDAAADHAAYSLAVIALSTDREYVARERLEHYLAHLPNGAFRADAAWRLATLLIRGRQMTRAARALTEVIDRSPSSSRRAEALFLLGSLNDRELDDKTGALVAYRRAIAEPSAAPDVKAAAEARLKELLQR